ncbi:sensor histidine kinase [Fodinibius salsisoli]|uniref:Histidine kinase n=1 Tax=Fodinibius salsisoli TaxID=2820877 RepID=A0ABT3PJ71_9BACT|nr:histidine kinase [Fodinibius salsisoli]MCW9705977.1 histidine kinase [Fodinibius salsisoli]
MKLAKIYQKLKEERLLLGLAVVVWLFLFLTTISKTYLFYLRNDLELEIGYIVLRSFLIWGGLAAFAPLIIILVNKFPLKGRFYKHIGVHLFFSLLLVPVHAVLFRLVITMVYQKVEWSLTSFMESVPVIMNWLGMVDPFGYWLIIGAYYSRRYYERYRERQLRNAHLEAELASIRLHILKVQLHPHFLFNTLHSINSLIYEAPTKARRVLKLLKRFLRTSINRVDDQQVPLVDELEFTGTYLEIEKTRFSDRLHIEKEIDEDTLHGLVPSFLLQPLVENAVKHGISHKMQPGKIRISAQKQNGLLSIAVEDDGPGLENSVNVDGIGLENIKQRLNQLYHNSTFELMDSPLGGLKVYIEFPFKKNEK